MASFFRCDPGQIFPEKLIVPRWNQGEVRFKNDSTIIREVFERLVNLYCTQPRGGGAIDVRSVA